VEFPLNRLAVCGRPPPCQPFHVSRNCIQLVQSIWPCLQPQSSSHNSRI